MPEDAVTNIQVINEGSYILSRHYIISGASCTTTSCLAFMVKTLLDHFGPDPILGASMVTVHATRGSQESWIGYLKGEATIFARIEASSTTSYSQPRGCRGLGPLDSPDERDRLHGAVREDPDSYGFHRDSRLGYVGRRSWKRDR